MAEQDYNIKLIVGLGNPGPEYHETKHNIGFLVIDALIKNLFGGDVVLKSKYNGKYIDKNIFGRKLFFLKPQTYMNLSGNSVAGICRAEKLLPEEVLVIHDDMDLQLGDIKLKIGGGSAGHKGIESIIANLESNKFTRLRVGIGRQQETLMTDYVLSKFTEEEHIILKNSVALSIDAVKLTIARGVSVAMNAFNAKKIVNKTRSKKLKKYETVVILNDRKIQDEGKAFSEDFSSVISGAGGEMVSATPLGRKMFAREIKKHKTGIYMDFVFLAKEDTIKDIPEKYKLDEKVLRMQIFAYDRPEKQIKVSEEILNKDSVIMFNGN